ncbi:MAG: 2-deoxy-D-gluconate 3-dehydrogenase [Candidatus Handelsmanbacteria bacterium RIFCSPLOWO2_12_FULL_64_10]|uniref:2-deoxy-D-gluconate 3-dehydrogenase n=1 Tax=Handelsmanbacteria sp. (strain RIFCSPLOWO2_12_FULL_64_10) TaxID=1817868 RepID=A0A1F6D7C6_HANXR|nr:MAG: 2-deoxy-D-gluconate 3-dehydrogenase [Candidatus Handelsmanbacteria bacterium RIFCSPLOWO2_12_FULL_64_10]
MSLNVFNLTGRSALVTGASKGLGQAMALALAKAGADLLITSRHRAEVDAVAREVASATGRKVVGVESDASRRADVESAVDRALRAFGKVDILVNNAGVNIREPMVELRDESWEQVIGINLTGPMMYCRAVGPHMIQRRYGRVINVASTLGAVSIPNRSSYAASKGGLIQLTKTVALEWAPHNITVNTLCPGPFETPINAALMKDPAAYQAFVAKVPMGRWGKPEELAGPVVFLASDASSFMTGATLFIDGGWTAQ